jgi:CheY-like chemotaxis protein
MPIMDGLEQPKIPCDLNLANIPIIALTAPSDDWRSRDQHIATGATDYLT